MRRHDGSIPLMRPPHAVTVVLACSLWLILVLLWQLHTERQKTKTARAELRVYIGAASRYATEAMVAQGKYSMLMAECGTAY